jgi:arylsulfatase
MEIDWSVGQVLAALDRHGLTQNTLVIFTSDNGPWLSYGAHAGSAGPLREGKGTVWEGGIRVPCLMRWPGRLPAGTVSDAMIMTIDLLPTLAQLIGAAPPALPVDGRDVWPLLSGQPDAASPHTGYGLWYAQNELQAVISGDGRWKLLLPHRYRTLNGRPGGTRGQPVRYENTQLSSPALYDLQNDISESTDVAPTHPDVMERLLAFAESCRNELGDTLTHRTGIGVRAPATVTTPPKN